MALYPTWTMPPTAQQRAERQPPVPFRKSFAFDFETGDFVQTGCGRVSHCNGHEAWGAWCVKTVLTQRFAYLAYTANYGCELDRIRSASRAVAEAEARRVISEALLADPRTKSVDDFAFEWQGDALRVAFTATPAVGTEKRIEVKLTYGN